RVDDHLAVGRPGDLDAPILEVRGHRTHAPFGLADFAGAFEEVGHFAVVDGLLALLPSCQRLLDAGGKFPGESSDEAKGSVAENLAERGIDGTRDQRQGTMGVGGGAGVVHGGSLCCYSLKRQSLWIKHHVSLYVLSPVGRAPTACFLSDTQHRCSRAVGARPAGDIWTNRKLL